MKPETLGFDSATADLVVIDRADDLMPDEREPNAFPIRPPGTPTTPRTNSRAPGPRETSPDGGYPCPPCCAAPEASSSSRPS